MHPTVVFIRGSRQSFGLLRLRRDEGSIVRVWKIRLDFVEVGSFAIDGREQFIAQ